MNHETLNRRDLGRSSSRRVHTIYPEVKPVQHFPVVPFGPHRGVTVPALFFSNLSYFRFLLGAKIFVNQGESAAKIQKQLVKISHLGQRIKAPRLYGARSEFLVTKDRAGNIYDVMLVRKGRKPKLRSGERELQRTALFTTWVAEDCPDRVLSRQRMMAGLKRCLFQEVGGRPSSRDCRTFFSEVSHFDCEPWAVLSKTGT